MDRFSQDPHGIIGIRPDANKSHIRRAYWRLAMKFHPDRNPDDPEAEERFKQVQWAYENLVGQKGQDKISSVPCGRKRPAPLPASRPTHPFYGFFWALRAHYAKRADGKENR